MTDLKVFLGTTYDQLQEHRNLVIDTITKLEIKNIYTASNYGSIDEADIFIGIIAHQYGEVQEDTKKSKAEEEYDKAVESGMTCLMYIIKDDKEKETTPRNQLGQFKEKVEKRHENLKRFTIPETLAELIAKDIKIEMNRPSSVLPEDNKNITDTKASIKSSVMTCIKRIPRSGPALLMALITLLASIVTILLVFTDPNVHHMLRTHGILLQPSTMSTSGTGLNVVVAGLGLRQADGTLIQTDLSDNISQEIYGQVQQFDEIANHLGPTDVGVRHILGTTAEARAEEARVIANTLRADIVIYGYVEPIGDGSESVVYTPEFYIAASWAPIETEFLNVEEFGSQIQILNGHSTNPEIVKRISTLDLFLQGLSSFILGEYETALVMFDQIIALNPDIEVVYIFAGNAATRLDRHSDALEYYTQSLEHNRPQYSRGLLARGSALKTIGIARSRKASNDYDINSYWSAGTTCRQKVDSTTSVNLLFDLAFICFEEAENSPDRHPAADLDVKLPFARADLLAWQSINDYGDFWDYAQADLQTVITIYESASQEKRTRIHAFAGLAHGYIAQVIMATNGDQQMAITELQQAIEILELDINHQWASEVIANYDQKILEIEAQSSVQNP